MSLGPQIGQLFVGYGLDAYVTAIVQSPKDLLQRPNMQEDPRNST